MRCTSALLKCVMSFNVQKVKKIDPFYRRILSHFQKVPTLNEKSVHFKTKMFIFYNAESSK